MTLNSLGEQRHALLRKLVEHFEADERVTGAWLSGSTGRDEEDEWSDLDLHVAIRDDVFEAVLSTKEELFAWGGPSLLVQANFPSESMPGGRFWLVVYEACISVDWNIGPASQAERPAASRIVFERQPIALATDRPVASADDLRARMQATLEFFWAMAPIAVKYAGRGHTRLGVTQCVLLEHGCQRLWELLNSPAVLEDEYHQNRRLARELDATIPRFGATIDCAEVLRVIARFCELTEALHPELARRGVLIPEAMPAEVRALAELAAVEVARGGTRPNLGSRR